MRGARVTRDIRHMRVGMRGINNRWNNRWYYDYERWYKRYQEYEW